DRSKYRTGLAQDQSGALYRDVARPARPEYRGPDVALRTRTSGERAARRDLPDGNRRVSEHDAAVGICGRWRQRAPATDTTRRGACRTGGSGKAPHVNFRPPGTNIS